MKKIPLSTWKIIVAILMITTAIFLIYLARLHVQSYPINYPIKWKFKSPGFGFTVAEGLVFAGGIDRYLYALDKDTGEEVWKLEIERRGHSFTKIINNTVYFKSSSNLYAIDIQGNLRWKVQKDFAQDFFPFIENDIIYWNNLRLLSSFDSMSKNTYWEFSSPGPDARFMTSPMLADGTIYIGLANGLAAIDGKNGKLMWKFTNDMVFSVPTVANETVYFGSIDTYLYAVNTRTGQLKWKFKTGDRIYCDPIVTDGLVYFGSCDGYLYALHTATGQINWKFISAGRINSSPSIADGVLYFGNHAGYLYALDIKTGQLKWKFQIPIDRSRIPHIKYPMIMITDGIAYVAYGDVYALDIVKAEKWFKEKEKETP